MIFNHSNRKQRAFMLTRCCIFLFLSLLSSFAIADLQCDANNLYNQPSQVLSCYMINYQKTSPSETTFIDAPDPNHSQVTVRTIKINSQSWQYTNHAIWQHTLKIYIPENIDKNIKQALLYV